MREGFLRRNQKWIWYLIAVPILATFSITGSMYGIFDRRPPEILGAFELPSGRKVEIDRAMYEDFALNLRAFSAGRTLDPEHLYRFLLLYHAAAEAGVRAPEAQISQTIRQAFPSKESYERILAQREIGGSRQDLERFLRRLLMAQNYEGLLRRAWGVPDGDEVVKAWQDGHEEYKVEYAAFSAAEIRKDLDAKAVTDEDLRAHFDGMSEAERNRKFRREAKIAIEGLALPLAEADESKFAGLLEGEEFPEADLKLYYNQNLVYRFKRPAEEKKEEEKTEEGAIKPPPSPFYQFEEVRERVLRELRLKRGLEKLLSSLKEEFGKEGFSWKSFGKPYGLESFEIEEPKTRSDLATLERFGSALIANQAFTPGEGEFSDIVALAPDDFYLYRIAKKIPEGVPPLEEIRDKILEDELDKRAMDLAKERAKAFHEAAAPPKAEKNEEAKSENGEAAPPPEDLFRKAAEEKGVEIRTIDFFSKTPPPEFWKEPESPEKFLKRYNPLFALKEGEISSPIEDLANRHVYVARVVERRQPDPAAITAKDFQDAKWTARFLVGADPKKDPFSFESLKRAFRLELK